MPTISRVDNAFSSSQEANEMEELKASGGIELTGNIKMGGAYYPQQPIPLTAC
jgi:hypothetical protein